jgi:hypothetical protein
VARHFVCLFGLLIFFGSPALSQSKDNCLRAIRPIAAGAPVARGAFSPEVCPGRVPARLHYNSQSRLTRASVALEPGDIVRPWPGAERTSVAPGDRIFMKIVVGTASVEREVVALQSAAAGSRLFVRDSAGSIFSIELRSQ